MSEPESEREPLPLRRPIAGKFDFMVRGWRPAASWIVNAILVVFGVVAPVVALWRGREPHLDIMLLGVLLTALKLANDRKVERIRGVTS